MAFDRLIDKEILELIRYYDGMTTSDLVHVLGCHRDTVHRKCNKLVKDNKIYKENKKGKYMILD